jgi:hypothetical protein
MRGSLRLGITNPSYLVRHGFIIAQYLFLAQVERFKIFTTNKIIYLGYTYSYELVHWPPSFDRMILAMETDPRLLESGCF